MPKPARNVPARPPSRGRPVPLILLLILAVVVVAWWLRRPAAPPQPTAATPTPEASPAATAAVVAPQPSASPEDKRFQPPKVLTTLPVHYPEQAFLNRVEGSVGVRFAVDDTGHVTEVVATRSSGSVLLDAVVLEYDLKKWTFQPATLDGKPVTGMVEREFEFHLDPKEQRALAEERLKIPVGIPDPPYPKEALALKPAGSCEIAVTWTAAGLVDTIILTKSSGSNTLDRVALRYAFMHWHLDPKGDTKKDFTKTVTFTPPPGPNDHAAAAVKKMKDVPRTIIASAEDSAAIARCHAVMRELRPHFDDEAEFVAQVQRQQAQGYRLAFVEADGEVRAVAGYRFIENLFAGKALYVDDLVSRAADRSRGHGGRLLDWLVERAREAKCAWLTLDSGVQRFGAHRFYLRKGMDIAAHHFTMKLDAHRAERD